MSVRRERKARGVQTGDVGDWEVWPSRWRWHWAVLWCPGKIVEGRTWTWRGAMRAMRRMRDHAQYAVDVRRRIESPRRYGSAS